MFRLFISTVLVAAAAGHLCLLSPAQRGSIQGLNKPASPDCILLESPCGGRPALHSPSLALKHDTNLTVIFQKNLDHWTETTPGYFSVSFGVDDMPDTFKEVARIQDKGEPSLHLYSANITLPDLSAHPHQTLQVSYVTKNSKAPPAFYQCADFMLF